MDDARGYFQALEYSVPGRQCLIYEASRDGATAIARQPLDGGPTDELTVFNEDDLFDFGYSFDGRFPAVTRGAWQHDIVLLSDLKR